MGDGVNEEGLLVFWLVKYIQQIIKEEFRILEILECILRNNFEMIMKCEMVPMRKGCWCFGWSVLSSFGQNPLIPAKYGSAE